MSYYGGLNLTYLDFKFDNKGEVWRSPLPRASKDNLGPLDSLLSKKFTEIVLLLSDDECQMYTEMNLREAYLRKGFKVIHFPIPDYGVPKMDAMRQTVARIVKDANAGEKILIHCVGGQGRTGTVLGCIARAQLGLGGKEAIRFVRSAIPEAIETGEQQELIHNFIEKAVETEDTSKESATLPETGLYPLQGASNAYLDASDTYIHLYNEHDSQNNAKYSTLESPILQEKSSTPGCCPCVIQ